MTIFYNEAIRLYKNGLSPIPIKSSKKAPAISNWQRYCSEKPTQSQIDEWNEKYPNANIGLCLGTSIGEDIQLGAIDIDDDEMIDKVKNAIGSVSPAKKGKKGLTIFIQTSKKTKNTKIKNIDDSGKPSRTPAVEILLHGSQTVIPPSIHPSGMQYKWLDDKKIEKSTLLPLLDEWVLDEIKSYCNRDDKYFVSLNEMVWLGVDEGGDTHDTCVATVAHLVSRNWPDEVIHRRIERAKREACERGGDTYDWPQSTNVIQGWIDSARAKGMTGSKKQVKRPAERVMADWALDELGGMEYVANINGLLRMYNNGHWPVVDVGNIKRNMYAIDPMLKEREARSAMTILHTLTLRNGFGYTQGIEAKNDPKKQRICLLNGTINLRTGELEQHNYEHELLHKLNFNWDDESKCPMYNKIINETFDNDEKSINVWDEFCALSLIDDMSFQRLLFLKGAGGNGKGTLSRVLMAMHDPQAVGSVGITDLNNERKRTSLVGKLINISGEQSRLNLVSDTYLKKITGGDPIDVRQLYQETQNNVNLSVRFVELVNEMPATSDSSHALKRRIIILNCPNKVKTPDLNLDAKLYEERSGILIRWIKSLKRLYNRKDFDEPKSSIDEVNRYMLENDSVQYWMSQCLEDCEKGTHSKELYASYLDWAKTNGYKHYFPEVQWGRRLVSLGYPVKIKRIGKHPMRVRLLRTIDQSEF